MKNITLLALFTLIPSISFAGGGQKLLDNLKKSGELSFSSADKQCILTLQFSDNSGNEDFLFVQVEDWANKNVHMVSLNNEPLLQTTVRNESLEVYNIAEGKITSIIITVDANGNPTYASYSAGHSSQPNGSSVGGCYLKK